MLVLHCEHTVAVAQIVCPGETTTVAVVLKGSVNITALPPTTEVLTVVFVKTVVLVLHFVHDAVTVIVEYPDSTGEITSV